MSKIVFDIETIGIDFDSLEQDDQNYILKYAEDEKKVEETKKKTALWPFTGQIAAICLINPETEKGKVYFQAPNQTIKPFVEDGVEYLAMSEKEILENFWRDARNYDQIVTFNGRGFDCPYIMLRSAILKIRPTRDLMPYRYDTKNHIDLLDQLTFYGAFRKFSLDFYCKNFELNNRKIEGMSGEKVQEYFAQGKCLEIARYCAADVRATAELYERWEKFVKC